MFLPLVIVIFTTDAIGFKVSAHCKIQVFLYENQIALAKLNKQRNAPLVGALARTCASEKAF